MQSPAPVMMAPMACPAASGGAVFLQWVPIAVPVAAAAGQTETTAQAWTCYWTEAASEAKAADGPGGLRAPTPVTAEPPSSEGSPPVSVCSFRRGARRDTLSTTASECPGECLDSDPESDAPAPQPAQDLRGQVWQKSQDVKGCREVQAALDEAPNEEARRAIAQELRGHVAKAMRGANSNHVLQRCVLTMQPESSQFMIEELMARAGLAAQASRHRYGCRVVQQLLKKCSAAQVHSLVETLLEDLVPLACHPFGNFVVKHILEFSAEEQRHQAVRAIERNIGVIGRTVPGAGVVAAALEHAAVEDRVWVARAAAQDLELLTVLAQARHGNFAVTSVLRLLTGRWLQSACGKLACDIDALRSSRYGKVVADFLESDETLQRA